MKFTIDVEPFTGQVFELLPQDDLTWAEAGELESVLGVSLTELDDVDTGRRLRRSSRALSAFLWISIRRQRPGTSYEDVANTPQNAVTWVPEQESPDPTDASATDQTTDRPD
jgi:hypothetical protein